MYFAMDQDKVYGAKIKNYLLEKSRVVKVEPNERGYHIFYFLLKGADNALLGELGLLKANGQPMTWNEFNFLKTGADRAENAQKEF